MRWTWSRKILLRSPCPWKRSISNVNQQQLSPQAMEKHGKMGGSSPTQGNSSWTKTPAGTKISNKWWNVFSFCKFHSATKMEDEPNFANSMGSQMELRNDFNLPSQEEPGLRSQSFPTVSYAPHRSWPFNKQIQLPNKHVAVSKCSGFSAQPSHYSAVKVKGSDIWCENYILTRCHVCLKFLFITT